MKQAIPFALFVAVLLTTVFASAQKTAVVTKSKQQTFAKPAQQKNIQVNEPPITDTMEYNLKKTIDKLSLFVLDPDIPVESITDSFLGNRTFGQPYYSSIIQFPGAIENMINRTEVNREEGTVKWQWSCVFTRMTRNPANKEMLLALKNKIDGIVKAISYTPKNGKNTFAEMSAYYDEGMSYSKTEEVSLHIYFLKPCYQTEQQSIDSLSKLYAPGLMNIETAQNAASKYCETLLAENISKEKVTSIVGVELKKAADKDVKIGYEFLLGATNDLKAPELMNLLTASQREQIRAIATAYLDAYKEQKPFDLKTFDPTPPKPQYFSYNGGTNITGTGTVNPLLYKQPEPEGKRVKCPICNGSGRMEVVDYSHTYEGIFSTITTSTSHWQTCTYCKGEGWITKYKKK